MCIDWESARYTKAFSQLNCTQTIAWYILSNDEDEDIIIFPPIEANLFKYKDLVNGHKEIKITKNNMVYIYKFIYSMLKIYSLSDVEFEK